MMKNVSFLIALFLLFCALGYPEQDGSGLKISVAGDIAGQVGLHEGSGASDRLDAREAEFVFYAPVDHLFDANLSFAAHYEGGIPQVELHEAIFGSTKLIPRSRFRIGQFFLGLGRLNQFHRHDWPFITAPRVHREFFDAEGVLDTGLEYSYLLPVPMFLELTAGLTNGWVYGHDHTAGNKPGTPTHYLRLATYTDVFAGGGMQVGLNYLGRLGNEGIQRKILGLDLTAKWKEGAIVNFFLQSELWYRELTPSGDVTQKALGFYVFPQYYLGENLYGGLRVDYFSNILLPDSLGGTSKNFDLNFVPTLTYKASEFSTLRLAYNHNYGYAVDRYTSLQRYFEVQAIFILGAHPAHDF